MSEMSEAIQAMAEHRARAMDIDRTGWTDEQWIADAERLMEDPDGSIMSLVNGHVMALLRAHTQSQAEWGVHYPADGEHPCPRGGVQQFEEDAIHRVWFRKHVDATHGVVVSRKVTEWRSVEQDL